MSRTIKRYEIIERSSGRVKHRTSSSEPGWAYDQAVAWRQKHGWDKHLIRIDTTPRVDPIGPQPWYVRLVMWILF